MTTISQYQTGLKLLIHCLSEIFKQSTGLFLYVQDSSDDRPAYPFATFLAVTPDHEEWSDSPVQRPVQVILQLDIHSNDYWQANDLAVKLHDALKDAGYKRFLKQVHMSVQKVDDVMSHNAVEGSNYDYAQGMDVTFELITGYEFEDADLNFTYSPSGTIDSSTITADDDYKINNQK